jgi:hypothetical protein
MTNPCHLIRTKVSLPSLSEQQFRDLLHPQSENRHLGKEASVRTMIRDLACPKGITRLSRHLLARGSTCSLQLLEHRR